MSSLIDKVTSQIELWDTKIEFEWSVFELEASLIQLSYC